MVCTSVYLLLCQVCNYIYYRAGGMSDNTGYLFIQLFLNNSLKYFEF